MSAMAHNRTKCSAANNNLFSSVHNHFVTWKFRVVANTEPHRVSRSTETINTSVAPTEFVRPACSTRPLALSLLPLAAPVILIVKSSVASDEQPQCIESIYVNEAGIASPKLHSASWANSELRKLHSMGAQKLPKIAACKDCLTPN